MHIHMVVSGRIRIHTQLMLTLVDYITAVSVTIPIIHRDFAASCNGNSIYDNRGTQKCPGIYNLSDMTHQTRI